MASSRAAAAARLGRGLAARAAAGPARTAVGPSQHLQPWTVAVQSSTAGITTSASPSPAPKRAAACVIGDELLNGKVQDSNTVTLARALFNAGIELRRVEMVPDDIEDIAQTVRMLSRRYDYVFTSGGIGPTHDDMTYEAIARAFSRTLTYHGPTLAKMEAFFGERRQPMTEAAKRMALFPSGSDIVEVPPLWVPLVVCENVYIMPGIPQLFNAMVASLPSLLGQHGTIYRQLLFTRFFEVNIAEDLQAAAKAFPSVSIGSYPRFGDARCPVMVSIEGRVEADVQACMQRLLPQLQAHTTVEACHAAAAAAGVSESRSSRL